MGYNWFKKEKIPNTEGFSEFEVQAFLFMALVDMGYRVKGEVDTRRLFGNNYKWKKGARFDLVIFDNKNKPLEIIEVKDCTYSIKFTQSRQHSRYSEFGLPVRDAVGLKGAKALLNYYQSLLDKYILLWGKAESKLIQ